ncbi:MAG: VanZ family protein [Candidatus Electryonea clarkiae]|nr:VanZ family protein [Candidatus Electryonea clarkiae]MDP8286306.1 VanZ family protein [Candidatus Electryonea clarkiae]
MNRQKRTFWNPRTESMVQYILFAILVVATPFIVVTRYLQNAVHILSHLSFSVFGRDIPYILIFGSIILLSLIFRYRKEITWRRIKAILVILIVILFAHKTQDLYTDMSFFDLQQNWHYIAYCAYVFFFFRAFNARKMSKNKMILYSFSSSLCMSTFDETFQFFMSNRIFDISDINKDALGAVFGLILVLFVSETYGTISVKLKTILKKNLVDYFKDPLSSLMLVSLFTVAFLFTSPLLTEHEYWYLNLLTGFCLFLFLMSIIHFSQYLKIRYLIAGIALITFISLSVSFAINFNKNIMYNSYGLTVYKGLPIPFFDIIIYQNGMIRLVDKKHHFRSNDRAYFFKQNPDILLIGSGSEGAGGKGFDTAKGTYFIFNKFNLKGTQVIILPTPEAYKKFNQLKEKNKNVLFVIHNTC